MDTVTSSAAMWVVGGQSRPCTFNARSRRSVSPIPITRSCSRGQVEPEAVEVNDVSPAGPVTRELGDGVHAVARVERERVA